MNMAAELDAEYPYRHSIVEELFIKTADDNYVAARWCFTYGLDVDFFWLAVHALEKYLKAALLLNGRSARSYKAGGKEKTYGHDIVRLYGDVQPLAPELLPTKMTCPTEINDPQWYEEPAERFIARLYDMGHADNSSTRMKESAPKEKLGRRSPNSGRVGPSLQTRPGQPLSIQA
jgi:hypothetical protein